MLLFINYFLKNQFFLIKLNFFLKKLIFLINNKINNKNIENTIIYLHLFKQLPNI